MDVVGDSSPIRLHTEGDFIQTDGSRTLGADDKVGIACALLLAASLRGMSEASDEAIKNSSIIMVVWR